MIQTQLLEPFLSEKIVVGKDCCQEPMFCLSQIARKPY